MSTRKIGRPLLRGAVFVAGPWIVGCLFAAPALTAANNVSASNRGEGAATISGYMISDVHYKLNADNPENIDSVTFTVYDAPVDGSTIKIRLTSGGTEWYECDASGTPAINITCSTTLPQATLARSDELTVVAAD